MLMLDLILASVALSFAIMGLWICFNWQGMIFEQISYSVEGFCYEHHIPAWVLKPLWSCPTCMSSFWGLFFYLLIGRSYYSGIEYIAIIPMTAFLNTLWCILLTKITDEGCG